MLVARREVLERTRSRAFRISLIVMVLLAAGGAVAGSLLGGGTTTYDIGVVGARAEAVASAMPGQVQGSGDRVRVSRPASAAAARAAIRKGRLDAAVIDGASVVVESDVRSAPARIAAGGARVAASVSTLRSAGLPAAKIGAALSPPPALVSALDRGAKTRNAERGIVITALVLLYFLLITYGSIVLTSVVEEKASRVVELLLVTVGPRRILAGKLLGIGVLGIGQIVAVGVAALIGREATGKGGIPPAGAQIFALSLLWFLLGYALFSAGYALLGSLVSRQEDTSSAQGPMIAVLVSLLRGGDLDPAKPRCNPCKDLHLHPLHGAVGRARPGGPWPRLGAGVRAVAGDHDRGDRRAGRRRRRPLRAHHPAHRGAAASTPGAARPAGVEEARQPTPSRARGLKHYEGRRRPAHRPASTSRATRSPERTAPSM